MKTNATDLRTTEAHYSFQLSFKIVLALLPQNEIQLLSRFEAGLLIWLWVEESVAAGFKETES